MQLAEKIILTLGQSAVQSARSEYLKQQKTYEQLKKQHDIVLEPEFYIEVPELLMVSAAGSWVYDYMQIPYVGDLIKAGKLPFLQTGILSLLYVCRTL